MAPEPKLSDQQVKEIRRRVGNGENQTDLAIEFGVNRKTIRRRLRALEQSEAERTTRIAQKRLRWQAERERKKLAARDPRPSSSQSDASTRAETPRPRQNDTADAYEAWLNTRKNLAGRPRAEADGLVRVISPDGTIRTWVERAAAGSLFDEGWTLEDDRR